MSKEKQKGFLRYCTVVKILVRSNNFAGADWIFLLRSTKNTLVRRNKVISPH